MSVRRILTLALAVLAATIGGVAAASALTGGAAQDDTSAAPPELAPRDGTTRVTPGAADPAGGPQWAVRTYQSKSGNDCVEVGRLSPAGRYGRLEADGRVTELPSAPSGVCGDTTTDPVVLAVDARPEREGVPARTVLYGYARPDVESVSAGAPGRAMQPLELSGDRTFVLVTEGVHSASEFPVDVRTRDGRLEPYRW